MSQMCQADISDPTTDRLYLTIAGLQSSLTDSGFAYNSLRTRYHKQLIRTNELIELTNELYVENCKLNASLSNVSSSASSTLNRQVRMVEKSSLKAKIKQHSTKRDDVYVVVGPPNLAHKAVTEAIKKERQVRI